MRSFFIIFLLLLSACVENEKKEVEKTKNYGGKELVISTWSYNSDKLRKILYEPFERKYNVKIKTITGNTADRYKELALNKKGNIDLFYIPQYMAEKAIKNRFFEKIDRSKLTNLENIHSIARAPNGKDYGVAYTVNRLRVAINLDKVPKHLKLHEIKSWDDLWKENLKNKIAIPNITTTYGPSMYYIASNHGRVDVETDHGEVAIRELKNLKKNMRKTYQGVNEGINLLKEGKAYIGLIPDYAYTDLKKEVPNLAFAETKDATYVNFNTINIVKGSKNVELAHEFINYALSEDVQRKLANKKIDAPVNKKVILDKNSFEGMTDLSRLYNISLVDVEFINTNLKNWILMWNENIKT